MYIKPQSISLNNKKYYNAEDLQKYDDTYFRGLTRTRQIIKKKNIPSDQYIFAAQVKGEWCLKDEGYKRAKVLIREGYVIINIPRMKGKEKKEEIEEKEEDKKEDTEEDSEEYSGPKENQMIRNKPQEIELTENDYFASSEGGKYKIEMVGKREYDKCYFSVKDIIACFKMPNLLVSIKDQKSSFSQNEDYVYFYIARNSCNVKNMYLTYTGVIRVLFSSRSREGRKFVDWAARVLFTHQLGTEEQKMNLSSKLVGVSAKTVREVLNKSAETVPCIYLIMIGKARELLKSDEYSDKEILCKFGRSDDLQRRLNEHSLKYKQEFKVDIQVLNYCIIDPRNICEAETDISHYFESKKVNYKKEKELVVLDSTYLDLVKKQFKMLQKEYSGHCKQLLEKIQDLENKIRESEYEREKQRMEYENKLKDKDNELIAKDNKLIMKDLEISNLKNDIQKKEIELLKERLSLRK